MVDRALIDGLRQQLGQSGFELVDPDILQPADLFLDLAGENIGRRLFFTSGLGAAELCLRPDFTLPIACAYLEDVNKGRFDPNGQALLGYVGKIFRQREKGPQESEQAGVEIIGGEDRLDAEARCIQFAKDTLSLCRIDDAILTIGSVMLFEAVLAQSGVDTVWHPRIRARFGHRDAMARLLARLESDAPLGDDLSMFENATKSQIMDQIDAQAQKFGLIAQNTRSTDEIATRLMEKIKLNKVRIDPQAIQLIREYLALEVPISDAMASMEEFCLAHQLEMDDVLSRFEAQRAMIEAIEPGAQFVAGFGRRLDYYSGLVFEYHHQDLGKKPLAGGGRYDRLLARMGANQDICAVGSSVWLDRLTPAVEARS